MDSENAPLLLNDENQVNANQSNAGRSHQHLCSRCSNELDSYKTTLRHVLLYAALLWCILVFSLLVGHMAVGERPNVITVFVAIWTHVTLVVLIVLLCVGRARYAHHKLGRTVTQIRVLCALGVSWLLLMAGIITLNVNPNSMCGWYNRGDCRKLFYAAHAFSWILVVTLFSAAYATYRRAVAIHGTTMTIPPPPPMVPAWRLSNVAETEGPMTEGTVKI
ncbi:hypothetical protein MSAN_01938200 [Mycena sanguinolenta]|uniref:Transmembrane protein n=1 Tax=Mycena sanguinolenta TaxID=230812 RepID=A0A8H7CQI7_9AGAR|nr:hypothetical protein MSAN_01938200 [Mycena sanguinolenta]